MDLQYSEPEAQVSGENNCLASNDRASRTPSSFHRAALIHLRGTEDGTILAWLSLLRSLEPGYQHVSRPGGLTNQQFDAVFVLLDCPNDLILDWLQEIRCSGR